MNLEQVYQFFRNPQPAYLRPEVAVCYVLSVLVEQESYATELSKRLNSKYPHYQLSDTVLYTALKFLEAENAITGYWKKVPRRGRPRRMFKLNPEWSKARDLADFWQNQNSLIGKQVS